MPQPLSDLSVTALSRLLRATERATGKDSVSAEIIRRTIRRKRSAQRRSKRHLYGELA